MDLIEKIKQRARGSLKRIVLPEGQEERVKEAARRIGERGIAQTILLKPESLDPNKVRDYAQQYFQIRKHKGLTPAQAKLLACEPVYYAAMMVRLGEADGFVAGASYTTPNVARAAIYGVGVDSRIKVVSSSFIMIVPDYPYTPEGVLLFADCGIVPRPSIQQLAQIALSSADLMENVLGLSPKVAMLSYSTKGSAHGEDVDKVREATQLVKDLRPELLVDGELQADSAIVPEVAQRKCPDSILKGEANVLIFPSLEAANCAYKLVQRLAKGTRAIGPILQGLNKPCSDLSRGCDIEDIIDCVAVTAIRARG